MGRGGPQAERSAGRVPAAGPGRATGRVSASVWLGGVLGYCGSEAILVGRGSGGVGNRSSRDATSTAPARCEVGGATSNHGAKTATPPVRGPVRRTEPSDDR